MINCPKKAEFIILEDDFCATSSIFASLPARRGAEEVVVSISNVTNTGFDIELDYPAYTQRKDEKFQISDLIFQPAHKFGGYCNRQIYLAGCMG